jgi:hypothetical protein
VTTASINTEVRVVWGMWMNWIFNGDLKQFSAQVPVTPVKILASHRPVNLFFIHPIRKLSHDL